MISVLLAVAIYISDIIIRLIQLIPNVLRENSSLASRLRLGQPKNVVTRWKYPHRICNRLKAPLHH
eukprot:scaffold20684_cov52-Attheya_sp.AAC.2